MKVLPLSAAFALQTAGPLRGSDDHVEMAVPSPVGDVKIVSPISSFVLNTLTLQKKGLVFRGGGGGVFIIKILSTQI